METLIELLRELASLSGPAMWIGGGAILLLFGYKTFIIGSIYGLAKFAIDKAYRVATKEKVVTRQYELGDIAMSNDIAAKIKTQLRRLAFRGQYIHSDELDDLEEAVNIVLSRKKESSGD